MEHRIASDGRGLWSGNCVDARTGIEAKSEVRARNVHVHNFKTGDLAPKRKEKEIEDKLELGEEGLAREDEYFHLLDINLSDFDDS
eukprot:scaffold29974_cov60-Cyclotella_meneghiniana.AAC.2